MFHILKALNQKLANVLKWLLVGIFVLLVLDVLWGVTSRYLLGNQAPWSEELARLLMVWLALLGAALVSREDKHLGLDMLVRSWPEDLQRVGRLFVLLVIFMFTSAVMLYGGWRLVSENFSSGQILPALGIAKAWFYLVVPVSGLLASLFTLEPLFNELLKGKAEESKEIIS